MGQRGEVAAIFASLPELETECLLLRKMRLDAAEAMYSYTSDPEVTRARSEPTPQPPSGWP